MPSPHDFCAYNTLFFRFLGPRRSARIVIHPVRFSAPASSQLKSGFSRVHFIRHRSAHVARVEVRFFNFIRDVRCFGRVPLFGGGPEYRYCVRLPCGLQRETLLHATNPVGPIGTPSHPAVLPSLPAALAQFNDENSRSNLACIAYKLPRLLRNGSGVQTSRGCLSICNVFPQLGLYCPVVHAESMKRWLRRAEDPVTADDKVIARCPARRMAHWQGTVELWGVPSLLSLEGTRAAIYVEFGARAARAFWGLDPFFLFWAYTAVAELDPG
jgi:hypothetical protein